MMVSAKRFILLATLCLTPALLAGCGGDGDDGGGGGAAGLALTASTIESATVNSHTHTVSLPFADLGSTTTVNYRSSSSSGHTHVIALSAGQLADLNLGYRVQVLSTPAADGHTHDWLILGGNLVYESMCYSCHGNSRRGTGGMSGRPSNSLQVQALIDPSGRPLSTAPAATPNPSY